MLIAFGMVQIRSGSRSWSGCAGRDGWRPGWP